MISVTSTRAGLTDSQKSVAVKFLKASKDKRLAHGDCFGGDSDLHNIAKELEYEIYIFPCNIKKARAFNNNAVSVAEEKSPLERNKDIVKAGDVLLVFPKTKSEEVRSGTWATFRFANKIGKEVWIIFPDGTTTVYNYNMIINFNEEV